MINRKLKKIIEENLEKETSSTELTKMGFYYAKICSDCCKPLVHNLQYCNSCPGKATFNFVRQWKDLINGEETNFLSIFIWRVILPKYENIEWEKLYNNKLLSLEKIKLIKEVFTLLKQKGEL